MKLLNIIIALTAMLMIGCASTADPQEQQLNTLSKKVDKLTMEVSRLKFQQAQYEEKIAELKATTQQTNQRVNNVATSYTK